MKPVYAGTLILNGNLSDNLSESAENEQAMNGTRKLMWRL